MSQPVMKSKLKQSNYAGRATQYANDVINGAVLASKWIKLAAKRHVADLAIVSRWSYDTVRANRICAFAERMPHEKGELQGQPLKLEDWQCFILCNIFGWVDEDGIRKYREALILVPRGNGKSPLAAIVALWMAFFDGEKGAEVYTGATSLAQALEVFRPAKSFIENVPAFARMGIVAAAKSIYQTRTASRFVPVIGRAKYGGSVYLGILDEAHQLPDATLYDAFKTGCNKRKNSLLLTISTAGVTAIENPCYQLQLIGEKVLDGSLDNDRLFVVIHASDDTVEWTAPEAVAMANPNLGISNDREAVLLDHAEAVRNPSKQNTFRTMHLNQWTGAAAAWMNMSKWSACYDPAMTDETVKQMPCWIGTDLASKLDLSSMVRVHRQDIDGKPHFYAFCRAYLPEERVNAPENQQYFKWSKQGHLSSTPGSSIDYQMLEDDALKDIGIYQVKELPYDPRYADQWSQRVSGISGTTRVEVPPSPAVLSPAMKDFESAVYDGRFHHDGNPILTWCMSNLLTRETALGNYLMPTKAKPENKIDCAIALLLAMCRARLAVIETPQQSIDVW
jgi:phage terminase large subunit-like protein